MNKLTNKSIEAFNTNNEFNTLISTQQMLKALNKDAERVTSSLLGVFNIPAWEKGLTHHFSPVRQEKSNREAIKAWVLSLLVAGEIDDKSIYYHFKDKLIDIYPWADFSMY